MAAEPAGPSVRDQLVDNQKIIDRLNAELARKTDEVRIIQQISSEISSTLDLDRILAISLDAMEAVLGFRHSMILLASGDERVLTVAASRGYDGGRTGAEIPLGRACSAWQRGDDASCGWAMSQRSGPISPACARARRQRGKPRLNRQWKCRG